MTKPKTKKQTKKTNTKKTEAKKVVKKPEPVAEEKPKRKRNKNKAGLVAKRVAGVKEKLDKLVEGLQKNKRWAKAKADNPKVKAFSEAEKALAEAVSSLLIAQGLFENIPAEMFGASRASLEAGTPVKLKEEHVAKHVIDDLVTAEHLANLVVKQVKGRKVIVVAKEKKGGHNIILQVPRAQLEVL